MTYDIVYRPDGEMVLTHLFTDGDNNLYCGKPLSPYPEATAANPPACVDCMLKLMDQALSYYEELAELRKETEA